MSFSNSDQNALTAVTSTTGSGPTVSILSIQQARFLSEPRTIELVVRDSESSFEGVDDTLDDEFAELRLQAEQAECLGACPQRVKAVERVTNP